MRGRGLTPRRKGRKGGGARNLAAGEFFPQFPFAGYLGDLYHGLGGLAAVLEGGVPLEHALDAQVFVQQGPMNAAAAADPFPTRRDPPGWHRAGGDTK